MTHRAGDLVGDLNVGRSEVHVVSDQGRPRSNGGYAGSGMHTRLTEVRQAHLFRSDLIANAFKLPFANGGQVLALRFGCGFLVKINRDSELVPHSLAAR